MPQRPRASFRTDSSGCSSWIVLIEHNMEAVMGLSSRMYALAMGRIIAEGTPETLRNDPAVLESYFGPPRATGRR